MPGMWFKDLESVSQMNNTHTHTFDPNGFFIATQHLFYLVGMLDSTSIFTTKLIIALTTLWDLRKLRIYKYTDMSSRHNNRAEGKENKATWSSQNQEINQAPILKEKVGEAKETNLSGG